MGEITQHYSPVDHSPCYDCHHEQICGREYMACERYYRYVQHGRTLGLKRYSAVPRRDYFALALQCHPKARGVDTTLIQLPPERRKGSRGEGKKTKPVRGAA